MKKLLFFLLLFSGITLQAQTIINVKGTVSNEAQEGLADVFVLAIAECLDSSNFLTDTLVTDENGEFDLGFDLCEEGTLNFLVFCSNTYTQQSVQWTAENSNFELNFICQSTDTTYQDTTYQDSTCFAWIECDEENPNLLIASGNEGPFTFEWNTGDTTQNILVQEEGEYCVTVTNSEDCIANYCYYYWHWDVDTSNYCYDPTLIDSTLACDTSYEPVCGCDGLTYSNPCVAETWYGVKSWTPGECQNYNDTLFSFCDINIDYTITQNEDGEYEIQFTSDDYLSDYLNWGFNDEEEEGATPIFIVDIFADSTISLLVCAYIDSTAIDSTLIDSVSCFGLACDTITILVDPDGLIDGTLYGSEDGVTGGAVTRSNGDEGDPLEGVTVQLLDTKGKVIQEAITDATGHYQFEQLYYGNYQLKVAIEGIEHDPFQVELDSETEQRTGIDFSVSNDAVTTSTQNINFAQQIKLFPNPVQEQLAINLKLNSAESVQLKVTNLFGQTIKTQDLNLSEGHHQLSIDMNEFTSGIYLISLQAGSEVYTQKILKQENR